MIKLIDKLEKTTFLTKDEYIELIKNRTPELSEYLFKFSPIIYSEILDSKYLDTIFIVNVLYNS